MRIDNKKRKKTMIVIIIIILTICLGVIGRNFMVEREKEKIDQNIKMRWFGYGHSEDDNSNTINPMYEKSIEKWEQDGLLVIMKETGVWTEATCERVSNSFTDKDSLEYQILYGGISFDDIDYEDFSSAVIKIGNEVSKGTNDVRSMHDYWEEAALLESTNNYD
ncbi:hypothetical protein [Butyrivibrio fibrisolvens]|uniref:hypothetical protein n=1 Tax=Butyrivibrio fibrisolvens TaxID=831 RepID=UPI0003B52C43|nr:hypothetical protein [Butyrivibrio fibrisolvens]